MKLSKNNLNKFLEYYHFLHDSYITNVNYLISEKKLELFVDVCWAGKPILKEDNTYETNKTKIRLIFNDIKEFSCKEIYSWDYINRVYVNYIRLDGNEYICFASSKDKPLIYVVCNEIECIEI